MHAIKRRLGQVLLAVVLVLGLAPVLAFAEGETGVSGPATITVENASKGETYKVYKLFDATVTGDEGGSIAYTGTIPSELNSYFAKDSADNISVAENVNEKDLFGALKTWAGQRVETASATGEGSALKFTNLPYGYYVVTSTQGGGAAITVTSTNPNATIYDKNSTVPNSLTKTVLTGHKEQSTSIGETVTYTVTFNTSNYDGAGENAKRITAYTITDTLPDFLDDVTVTSIVVDNDGNGETTDDQVALDPQPFVNKAITLKWYDAEKNQHLYRNGATVTVTYTAKVTDKAAIDGNGNTNTVTLKWTKDDDDNPDGGSLEDTETIYTYAIALKKIDDKGNALSGATFQFPFYVKETADSDGAYVYAGTEAGEGLTNELTTPDNGLVIVKGVAADTYEITEVAAPNGFNMLTGPVSVTADKTGETSTHVTIYLDANGNVTESATSTEVKIENDNIAATAIAVVNKAGSELPGTGGMGTTILYIIGGLLVVGAGVALVVRRRMSAHR